MDGQRPPDQLTEAAGRVRSQRSLVVLLAKEKRFDELPLAHQVLRQLEDALKIARAEIRPES